MFFLTLLTLALISCREEIISPKNDSGNVNEPYKSNIGNSYTFILNAQDLSQKVIDYPLFSYTSSSIFISVLDHNSGSVEITLLSRSKQIIYKNKIFREENGSYSRLQGTVPEIIEINLSEFTGKLKIQLTGIL
jgi:hypothetical protein